MNMNTQSAIAPSVQPTTPAQTEAALNPHPSTFNLALTSPPVSSSQPAALIEARPLAPSAQRRKIRRNGRVASLPRIQRDMVNHMLWNAVPYKNIVAALDEAGFAVTDRNISNWAAGGYLEWSLAQEQVLQNRLNQDQLLDFLRRDDAPELPEVGLQAVATRLSQVFLQKLARADDPEAHLDNFSSLVDLLCRLNREISATQKQRDDSRRSLGHEYDPARVKEEDQISAIENERFYSNPPPESGLPAPSVPPALPPIPTASLMAGQAREERHDAKIEREKHSAAMMRAIKAKFAPASKPEPLPTEASR
jgi:hypothetical protein